MMKPEGRFGAGLAVAALGAGLGVLAFLQPQRMHAPAWVVYAAALAFVLAGGLLVAQARGHALLQAWLPVFLLACLLAPPVWIGFGSGYRRCGVAVAAGAVRLLGVRPDLPCRIAFGAAALAILGMLLLAIRQAARSARDRSR